MLTTTLAVEVAVYVRVTLVGTVDVVVQYAVGVGMGRHPHTVEMTFDCKAFGLSRPVFFVALASILCFLKIKAPSTLRLIKSSLLEVGMGQSWMIVVGARLKNVFDDLAGTPMVATPLVTLIVRVIKLECG
jgi:hypothetical protein